MPRPSGRRTARRKVAIYPAPDGNDEADKKKAWYEHFWDGTKSTSDTAAAGEGVVKKLGDWWNDPSQIGRDASSAWESLPTAGEAWQGTKDFAAGAARGAGHVAGEVWNDPVGSAGAAGGWIKDQAVGAYEEGGVAKLAGAAVGVAAEVVNPLKKVQQAKRVGEALDEAGDLARAERKADSATRERDDGARSTARWRRRVECFDMPPGMDPKEYDRQLAEQMKTINEMTADDMAYAHWVLEKAGGTDALRQPYAQTRHRNEYKQMLIDEGMLPSQAAAKMEGLHATHFLDMIAGGHPTVFSRDTEGRPVLGAGDVNSDIGNRWTQRGRASSLRDEAETMRRNGQPNSKMSVLLERCK